MGRYDIYESLLERKYESTKKMKKMKRPIEDRDKGRKLNHRTKKNKTKSF